MSDGQRRRSSDKRRAGNKKKLSKKSKVLISILVVLTIIIGAVTGVYLHFKNMFYVESAPITEKDGISYKEVDGVTNVLLLGTDGRTIDETSRADSIIIATIDNVNKNVKLTSIMRDTLVEVPGYGEQKVNAAYALGGEELLMETLSDNFGIKLNKYVAVNFWGFESIIDEIGGLDIEVKDYEVDEVNKYIGEATGGDSPKIEGPGLQHLNGKQALSYARIRKVGNGSYERDERQRQVLYLVAEKLREQSLWKWPSLAESLNGQVKTNIEMSEALNLAYTIYKLPALELKELQIPQNDLSWGGLYKDKGWVLLYDKEQNSQILHDFIFDNKDPDPKEFYVSTWLTKLEELQAQEDRYNIMQGINPEEYQDTTVEPEIKPVQEPTIPQVETPKEEVFDLATLGVTVGGDVDQATSILAAKGINIAITNPKANTRTIATLSATTAKKGDTIVVTLVNNEVPVPDNTKPVEAPKPTAPTGS